ncbi:MAG: hypothetical protein HOQ05_04570 [Corynebacteriales bacterium]|nr:hypothetical protein [Mycobacteriales bacterium]
MPESVMPEFDPFLDSRPQPNGLSYRQYLAHAFFDLHAHPELSNKEFQTTQRILYYLWQMLHAEEHDLKPLDPREPMSSKVPLPAELKQILPQQLLDIWDKPSLEDMVAASAKAYAEDVDKVPFVVTLSENEDRVVTASFLPGGNSFWVDIVPRGTENQPFNGVRADIDALDGQDATPGVGDEFVASLNPNVAHNCGHDLHATIALAAAAETAARGKKPTRFIFQHAEEPAIGGRVNVRYGAGKNLATCMALHARGIDNYGNKLTPGEFYSIEGPINGAAIFTRFTVKDAMPAEVGAHIIDRYPQMMNVYINAAKSEKKEGKTKYGSPEFLNAVRHRVQTMEVSTEAATVPLYTKMSTGVDGKHFTATGTLRHFESEVDGVMAALVEDVVAKLWLEAVSEDPERAQPTGRSRAEQRHLVYELLIVGRGGHSSRPKVVPNPQKLVTGAAAMLNSRFKPRKETARQRARVASWHTSDAETAPNAIPTTAAIRGVLPLPPQWDEGPRGQTRTHSQMRKRIQQYLADQGYPNLNWKLKLARATPEDDKWISPQPVTPEIEIEVVGKASVVHNDEALHRRVVQEYQGKDLALHKIDRSDGGDDLEAWKDWARLLYQYFATHSGKDLHTNGNIAARTAAQILELVGKGKQAEMTFTQMDHNFQPLPRNEGEMQNRIVNHRSAPGAKPRDIPGGPEWLPTARRLTSAGRA